MKRSKIGTARRQFLNLFENRVANVIIGSSARENQHQYDRHRCDQQANAQDPELPSSLCSRFVHGWAPGVVIEGASIGCSSMRRRGFVSSNQAAVRSLTPCSISTSRI